MDQPLPGEYPAQQGPTGEDEVVYLDGTASLGSFEPVFIDINATPDTSLAMQENRTALSEGIDTMLPLGVTGLGDQESLILTVEPVGDSAVLRRPPRALTITALAISGAALAGGLIWIGWRIAAEER